MSLNLKKNHVYPLGCDSGMKIFQNFSKCNHKFPKVHGFWPKSAKSIEICYCPKLTNLPIDKFNVFNLLHNFHLETFLKK